MKGLLAHRPSPAMVVALIALVCALTGTAWAALGKNSVGTKQLKNNAVTTAKIKKEAVTAKKVKKHSLTGQNIDLAKLGTVPSATNATNATHADSATSATTAKSADTAGTLAPLEAIHFVGTPGQPPFIEGSNFPSDTLSFEAEGLVFRSVGFYKDHEGIVHLQGIAKGGSSGGIASVFTLPPGFRPAAGKLIVLEQLKESAVIIAGSNTALSGTDLSGKVIGSEEKPVVLDGITFRAES